MRLLPSNKLIKMCRWMGSHFSRPRGLTIRHGVAFSIELLLGSHIFGFLGGPSMKILGVKWEMYQNVCR